MGMLQRLKLMAYRAAAGSGFFTIVAHSPWRRRRLAILCYHGIALDDEHRWSAGLYITDVALRSRLARLRDLRCNVLPLGEAVERLYNGTLPHRSVAITFDDGFYDFYAKAAPVLREYGVPATVYVSSYYAFFNRPVFDPMLAYLLWRCMGRTLSWPEVAGGSVVVARKNLQDLWNEISRYAAKSGLSASKKDLMLEELAERLGAAADYKKICSSRILQLMNPDELGAIAAQGFDIQLHTHRHRMPEAKDLLAREIEDNQTALAPVCGSVFRHFCYPSGVYYTGSEEVLRNCDLLSATTCDPGLASSSTNPYYLPRFCDSMRTHEVAFSAWTTGAFEFMPHRRQGNGRDERMSHAHD